MAYLPRIVDDELAGQLRSSGAVLIEGPKAVGKTATAQQVAASVVRLDIDPAAAQAASVDPGLILGGDTPRLIDEWQVVPGIWNRVRHEVDARSAPGQFILTGSAVPADDATRHTGALRITRLRMRPMTLFEAGASTADVSVGALFTGAEPPPAAAELPIPTVAELVCRGGWPLLQGLAVADAQQALRDYLTEISHTDIQGVDGVSRDPAKVDRVIRSVARNVGTMATITSIASDTAAEDDMVTRRTVPDYLKALDRLMVMEDQPAWAPQLRSRVQLRVSAKRHFVDPCLAAAALGATPEKLLADLNYFGFLFESLVVRDLRVYTQRQRGQLLHYRDNTNLEVDAVIQLFDGRWAGLEVKLGGSDAVDAAARHLLSFVKRIDQDHAGAPAFLAVVTASGYAYRRPDGVLVLPIGCLGP